MNVQLVRSGVAPIDAHLGGIAAGEITLVTGRARSGKTCFALSYACAALERGEAVLFVTSDSPETLLDHAQRYMVLDLKPYLRSRKLTLLSFGASFQNKIRSLGDAAPPLVELGRVVAERGVRHVVMDTIDPILAAVDLAGLKPFVQGLVEGIRRMGATCLCTSVARGNDALRLGVEELSFSAGASFELFEDEDHRRTLLIHRTGWKSQGGAHLPIELARGRGIVATGSYESEGEMPGALERGRRSPAEEPRLAPANPWSPPTRPAPARREPPPARLGRAAPARNPPPPPPTEPEQPRRPEGRYLRLGGPREVVGGAAPPQGEKKKDGEG